ncbi:SRPBCC family protein [Metabacillus iocasae]|uniref:Membrane protein n=1 Tax=Priestia iocasae TaxID=2291674 RepID=A0ABS2QTZ8_9BACI|nr:SRPBCC family protein [Metabacillus iocasae]MBM7702402.1 putative membrane protein [Metabacillus iocasae]
MSAFQDHVIVNVPLERAFAFASNMEHAPKMMKHILKVEKLTEGPIQVGTSYKETRAIRGKEASAILTVVEFVPNERYSVQNEVQGLETIYHYRFEGDGERTHIHFSCDINASTFMMKLVKPLFTRIIKKEDGNHLQEIKKAIENE